MVNFRHSFFSNASAETRAEAAAFIAGLRRYGRRNSLIRRAALVAFMP